MKTRMHLKSLLAQAGEKETEQLELFALLILGVVESIGSGRLTVSDAVRMVFNAENCKHVRGGFRDKTADKIMSHAVQLPDLFEVLPAEETHRQLRHELETIRTLCLKLLEKKRRAA